MALDLVVRNGLVTTSQSEARLDIGIAGDDIVVLSPDLSGQEAGQVIDAGGERVFPGFIDPHTHMELPVSGTVSSDDFYTGTVAAACGGITTIVDFAGAVRGQSLVEAMQIWRHRADPKVAIDYGLHMIVPELEDWQLDEIPKLVEAGITTVKCMMAYKRGPHGSGDATLLRVIWKARESGALPMVHAENGDAIDVTVDRLLAEGCTEPRWHPVSRPAELEAEAIYRACVLASLAEMPMYIVHLSSGAGLEMINACRRNGWPVLTETCPQYLTLTAEEYERPGFEAAKYVCSPPLRTDADRRRLWQGLERDEISLVASDHCPFFFEGQKERGLEEFSGIPNGVPTIQPMFSLVFSEGVGSGRISMRRFVELSSTNAARIFGMYPRKGEIAEGSDADLVIFDPHREVKLSRSIGVPSPLRERVDYTPYEGRVVTGWPDTVIARGEVVVIEGEPTEGMSAGRGRYVSRGRFDPATVALVAGR
ncbi:MAG TPA: dihydropyrimidinase [Chloroflexota bacterium]|nr:dihydropyrimidinase [Chloroflexota bacterium]